MESGPTQWNPWEELEKLQAETNRLWESFLQRFSHGEGNLAPIGFIPNIDFIETNEDYRLFLAVPGLIEQDLDLSVEEHTLTVRGERQPPYDPGHHQPRIVEWRYGFFERRIDFPGPIASATLRATYEAGVLTIVVKKPRS